MYYLLLIYVHQAFRRYLGKRALVVCVDEFRTSKICYGCDNLLMDINDEETTWCDHKTKYITSHFVRNEQHRHRRRRWCLNEDDEPMHWTSACPTRVPLPPNDYRSLVYPIKLCPQCQSVAQPAHGGPPDPEPHALVSSTLTFSFQAFLSYFIAFEQGCKRSLQYETDPPQLHHWRKRP